MDCRKINLTNLTIRRTAWPLRIKYAWLEANSDYADHWNVNLTAENPVPLVQGCFDSKIQLMGDKHILNEHVIMETPVWLLAGLSKFRGTNLAPWTRMCLQKLRSCLWLLDIEFDYWISHFIVEHWNWLWSGTCRPSERRFDCQKSILTIEKASFTFEYSMSLSRFQCDCWQSHSIVTKPVWLLQIESDRWSFNVTQLRQRIIVIRMIPKQATESFAGASEIWPVFWNVDALFS